MKTKVIKVDPQYPDMKDIAHCAKIIRKGGLVVFPTETVYGVAADFSNPKAMQRLREVKRRTEDKPFSMLISQRSLVSNYTSMTDPLLYKLIWSYWPGPLTLVVPSKEEGQTVGVRMPNNEVALRLVQESQCTVAAPSANYEGNPPPSTCEAALKDMDGLVDVAIDGGTSELGLSSSVIDLTKKQPVVLREGAVTQEDLQQAMNKKIILFVCTGNSCRSVMAEYLLRDMVRGRDDVEVLSAGTSVFLKSTASAETIIVLREEGIDALEHVSQPIGTVLLKQADLIFVMTRQHRMQVLERVPQVEKRVYLLREFAKTVLHAAEDLDIPDPIGRTHQAYKDCLVMIKEALHKVVELV
ncbi:Arsenate reductase thioredoxin-coupled, LMWP family [hydrothermal vent metagenome]|uniref:L-threonylcarbamoyladenylate synthase n=1 Tax=hydrothermal vent metagenome TaxID=652676 RepID=A0A3B1D1D3_9ZZZZ